jgi:hypothetical protein
VLQIESPGDPAHQACNGSHYEAHKNIQGASAKSLGKQLTAKTRASRHNQAKCKQRAETVAHWALLAMVLASVSGVVNLVVEVLHYTEHFFV